MKKNNTTPQRKNRSRKFLEILTIICLLFIMVYGSFQLYAKNMCAEFGLSVGVYSIPTGVSCTLGNGMSFLVPIEKIREEMNKNNHDITYSK